MKNSFNVSHEINYGGNTNNFSNNTHNTSTNQIKLMKEKKSSSNSINRSNFIEKMSHPHSTKFKSVFDKQNNPFKYFMDIRRGLKNDAGSLLW
jgi:hypothetical protein